MDPRQAMVPIWLIWAIDRSSVAGVTPDQLLSAWAVTMDNKNAKGTTPPFPFSTLFVIHSYAPQTRPFLFLMGHHHEETNPDL